VNVYRVSNMAPDNPEEASEKGNFKVSFKRK